MRRVTPSAPTAGAVVSPPPRSSRCRWNKRHRSSTRSVCSSHSPAGVTALYARLVVAEARYQVLEVIEGRALVPEDLHPIQTT